MHEQVSQNEPPEISVVMPVHNAARYLDAAIQSVRDQTFPNFELIMVDDGSTDDSASKAQRHADLDARIRLIKIEHCGVARARNIGLRAARAPWIAKMDADDIAHPERFERQLAFLHQHPNVVLMGTYAWMIGPTDRTVGQSTLGPTTREEFLRDRADVRVNFLNPTVMYSRQVVLDAGGYSEDYPSGEDYELFNRLATNHMMLSMPEHLLYYRIHDSATGTRSMRAQAESWSRVRENIRRQRDGLRPLSLEEFRALRRQSGPRERLRRELRLRSRYAYRKGGARLASGRPTGLAWLALSFVLFPSMPLKRLKRQVLAPLLGRAEQVARSIGFSRTWHR